MSRLQPTAIVLLLMMAPLAGCSVCRYARLVLVEEPALYCEDKDDEASMALYRSMADRAWAETGACCPESCLEADYAWGFREGFAELVYAGGDGEPPAMPPRPYWQVDLRTAEGAAAVESWFAGYRHGARIASDGGYRRTATLRLSASLKDCDACGCPDDGATGTSCLDAPSRLPTIEGPEIVPMPAEEAPDDAQPVEEQPTLELPSLGEPGWPASSDAPPALEAATAVEPTGNVRTAIFQIVR